MSLILRTYQEESVAGLREGMRAGHKRQLLVAPTGAGKTAIATYMMEAALKKRSRAAFVVDRVSLVDQTSAALDKYGIPHGVIQAGHWRQRGYEPLQVCSAQTLEKRGFFPNLDLLFVDEAHCVRKETATFMQSMEGLTVIGMTATPFSKGLSELYSNVVNVTTTNKLISDGFLVPLSIYCAVAPDMAGAKVVAGEWSDKEIETRGMSIIGDIVAEWTSKTEHHFGGPVKTICFSATVEHGEELCRQFNEAGYRFEQISYKSGSDERRRQLIDEFRKPDSQIVGLVSCEIFTKGFDVPDVLCGISARPYRKSFSSHIQQLGRVMRPSDGKTMALWLDHSGNALRFHADMVGLFEHGVQGLNDGALDAKARKEPEKDAADQIRCSQCKFLLPIGALKCPACGHERRRLAVIEEQSGVMVMLNGTPVPAVGKRAFLSDKNLVWEQLVHLSLTRKNGDSEAARRFAQAQYRQIYGHFAHRTIENTSPRPASVELASLVQSHMIRWAKKRTGQLVAA